MRGLPAVHRLLNEAGIAPFVAMLGSSAVKETIEDVLREARAAGQSEASGASEPDPATIIAGIVSRLRPLESATGLRPVLNGTGILLHTNLGRAPLAREALDEMRAVGAGYSNLEFDFGTGARGSRYERVSSLLRTATGAEDGLVVNNCAAAVLLIVDTFARGREVIVSRNQLIEIGGGFRLPAVLARSGARLVEVGTTNKVYLHDFEAALGPDSSLLLRSHPSNYSIDGFVADVSAPELADLGRRAGVTVVEDLGSGALVALEQLGLPHERTVQEAVSDGIDLVCFSGDKLLGGPQAGIIVGRSALVTRMRTNPLLRALRVDKATLAALAATLRLYLEPKAWQRIPLYAMLSADLATLRARASALASELADARATVAVVETRAQTGGGTLPLAAVPSAGVALTLDATDPGTLAARLRSGATPIVTRVDGRSVVIDMRTIPPERDGDLAVLLRAALT